MLCCNFSFQLGEEPWSVRADLGQGRRGFSKLDDDAYNIFVAASELPFSATKI